jgi:MATE family multidrug resistance protein
MAVAWGLGLLLIALSGPIRDAILWFMGADGESSQLASRYFNLLIFGAPASLALFVLNGRFIGVKRSSLAMWLSMIINVTNIVGSLVFVYALDMGIEGVALGTLVAQAVGFGCGMAMAMHGRALSGGSLRRTMRSDGFGRFFKVNTDIFLRTLCLVAVTVWFTRSGARQSDVILSVNALLMQLFILFSYIMDGFAYAGEALVGEAVGARNDVGRRGVVGSLFGLGAMMALLFTAAYALFGDEILALLSDDSSVATAAKDYRWWAVAMPIASFAAFVWDGVFIGQTMTRGMLASMVSATAMFFIVLELTYPSLANHGLWLAFILYLSMRGVAQTLIYRRHGGSGVSVGDK